MKIPKFHFYHGAVLSKLLRQDSSANLTLVQSDPAKSWAQYVINDDISLMITHSAQSRRVQQKPAGISWTFQVRTNPTKPNHRQHFALIGTKDPLSSEGAIICLLNPEHIGDLSLGEENRSVTVRKPDNKGRLLVYKDKAVKLRIPQNAIDNLKIAK